LPDGCVYPWREFTSLAGCMGGAVKQGDAGNVWVTITAVIRNTVV
jgi:hypothetical protein